MDRAPNPHAEIGQSRAGLLSAISAYCIWGLFPIYFVNTKVISALELLAHRVVWSLPFGAMIILLRGQWPQVRNALTQPRLLAWLSLAAFILSINWGVYIWAVQNGQIFQGSLGYYINPLIYVAVAVVFFGERMGRLQTLAVILAAIGVAILTIYGGVFPWIALVLAATFTSYGVIKKQVEIGAMPGLIIEVIVLFPFGLLYLLWLWQLGTLGLGEFGFVMDGLILLTGPITVLPLLAFAFAARRIRLSTLGILQFIGPTLQFLCGVYYGEPFTTAHGWCFGLIWTGVALFSFDAWQRRPRAATG